MTTTDGDQTKPKPFVELAIAAAAPALAVMTGLIYGVLVLAHSEFHSELGVRPSDAGVEYGPGLGGAVGAAYVPPNVHALKRPTILIH